MKKVLIIDDDEGITSLLKRALSRTGDFAVQIAYDGEDGLNQVRLFEPDIILLDLSMPKLKGAGVFGALRNDEDKLKIPVIVISGQGGMDEIYERMGALFFKKPFPVETLVAKVRELTRDAEDLCPEGAEAQSLEEKEAKPAGRAPGQEETVRTSKLFKPTPKKVSDDGREIVDHGAGVRKKILLVENEASFAAQTSQLLLRAGYDVEVLSSAKEIFAKINALNPDLLMIKFELPDQRGDKIVLKLREEGRHLHIVLYTLTAQKKVDKMALNSILHNTYYKSGLADVVEIPEAAALLNKVDRMFKGSAA